MNITRRTAARLILICLVAMPLIGCSYNRFVGQEEAIKAVGNGWPIGAHLTYSPGAMRSSWPAVNERSAGHPATGVEQEERRWPTR